MRPAILVALCMMATGCGADDASAPGPGPTQTVCNEEYCVDYPADWDIELGADFVVLTHPEEPEAQASVGLVDMRGVVEGVGGMWPAGTEETVEAFWEALDELGSAGLSATEELDDGSVRSSGSFEGGRLWHRLVPLEPPEALGVEVRAPHRGWEPHADIIVGGLRPVPGA